MAKKKKVKETYEEIAVVETVKEEPEPNRARTICDADIIIGLLEMDSAVKKIDELNKRIDNIIDAHERCKTLRNL